MKNIITFSLIAFVLFACNYQKESVKEEDMEKFSFPVFIDERGGIEKTVNIKWMNDGNHRPMYLGKLKDTIEVERIYGHLTPPPGSEEEFSTIKKGKYDDYFLEMFENRNFKSFDSVPLKILVDTTQFISNDGRKAYPVLIENQQTDTIYIGYGIYIPIITEALDEYGRWRPIENRYVYTCGFGLELIILPPKQFVVTSVLEYSGKYKTKLRIRYGQNYSREFTGSINKTQFESE